jgi:peroxiredoxin
LGLHHISVADAAVPAHQGAAAPDFVLPSVQGGNIRLSEYRGQVVAITFWSSRCSVCGAQLADLADLQKTYSSAGLVTLAVSVDDDMVKAREFALSRKSVLPMLLDANRAVGRTYGIDRLPTTVLVDRSGRVQQWFRDYRRTDNSYISRVRGLLDDLQSVSAQANQTGSKP